MRGESCWYSHGEATVASSSKGKGKKGGSQALHKGARAPHKGKGKDAKGKQGVLNPLVFMSLGGSHPDELYSEAKAAKQRGDTPLAIELLFTAIQIDATMGPQFSSQSSSKRASKDLEKWALTNERAIGKSLAIFERVNRRLGLSMESGSEDWEEGFSDDLMDFDSDCEEEVIFLRPDGTTESKSVAWCLDNDFFEVEPGLWSGPWYEKAMQPGATSSASRGGEEDPSLDALSLYTRAELMEARDKARQIQVGLEKSRDEAIFTNDYMKMESELQLMQAREYAAKRHSQSQKKLQQLRQVVARGVEALNTGDLDVHEQVLTALLSDFKEDADAFLVAKTSCYVDSVEPGSPIDYVCRLLGQHARLTKTLLTDVLDLAGYWSDVPFCRTLLVRQGLLQLVGEVLDAWPISEENSAGIRLKALEALPQVIVDRDSHTQAVSSECVALLRGLADSACQAEQPAHQFYALSIAANGLGNPGTGDLARALVKQGLLGPAILLEHAGGEMETIVTWDPGGSTPPFDVTTVTSMTRAEAGTGEDISVSSGSKQIRLLLALIPNLPDLMLMNLQEILDVWPEAEDRTDLPLSHGAVADMNEMQLSYLLGRETPSYGGCQIYTELDWPGEKCLDLLKLEEAVKHVVRKEPLLRAMYRREDKREVWVQEIRKDLDWHLKLEDDPDVARMIWSRPLPSDHFWALGASKPEGKVRLHLAVDMTFLDATSWWMVFRKVAAAYDAGLSVAIQQLEPSDNDFFEYCNRRNLHDLKGEDEWKVRLASFPLGPELSWCKRLGQGQVEAFGRLSSCLPCSTWLAMKKLGQNYGVTSTNLVLTYFQDALAFNSRCSSFTLTATVSRRPPECRGLGEFTNVALLPCDEEVLRKDRKSRAQEVKQHLLQQLQLDQVSGMHVMRLWRQLRHEELLLPVVVTSLLDVVEPVRVGGQVPSINYQCTQTPTVRLDIQVYESCQGLQINFDFDKRWLSEDVVKQLQRSFEEVVA
ncbi:bacA [Symbiodinium necroappetens]|uniref:BacA protein n=1 Tax=Symbiodinium necroappetens TaxID=1628268 RepID=A0A812LT35_9DINO|nr:bacA [Symbiodinium necroappetens]